MGFPPLPFIIGMTDIDIDIGRKTIIKSVCFVSHCVFSPRPRSQSEHNYGERMPSPPHKRSIPHHLLTCWWRGSNLALVLFRRVSKNLVDHVFEIL